MDERSDGGDVFSEQLAAYALGTLDRDEAARLETHLAACPECRQELRELVHIAAMLPAALAVDGPALPAHLKARVMAATDPAPSPSRGLQASPNAAPGPTPVRRLNVTILARLAAAAVVLLSLGWSVRLAFALEQERAVAAGFAALVSQQEIVLEVVDSDETVRRVLRTTQPESCPPGACPYGKLFTRTNLQHVVAMAARLPALPAGEVYRLWLTTPRGTETPGMLTVDDKGFGLLVFDAPVASQTYDRAEVIRQPAGQLTQEGEIVLRWTPDAG